MTDNKSNIPIDSLEFDDIKNNLKTYLQGQDLFRDYNFEGSALSTVLDLLAYNTHYQAYYANMAANESFLDSAVFKPSVVSLAKHLNYTPRSSKAAQLIVDVIADVQLTDEVRKGNVFLTRETVFTGTSLEGETVPFVNLQTYKATVRNGVASVPGVVLHQGYMKQIGFVANIEQGITQKFVIPDRNVDIDTLIVSVEKSQNESFGTNTRWVRATDINVLTGDSPVYFVQNNRDEQWEIYFGDGILGRAIENGNLITLKYLVTLGSQGNGIGFDEGATRSIRTRSPVVGQSGEVRIRRDASNRTIVSFGGRDPETVDSIRFYAPKNYQSQDRAVTADDYLAVLGKEYSDRADSFFIWGGEENDPPQYGKVYISIKPKVGIRLSVQEKQAIEKALLSKRNLVTILPEVVDPDVLYINPSITVYYDEGKTKLNKEAVENAIRATVTIFASTNLGSFRRDFRLSRFSSVIDGTSVAINSNNTRISATKRVEVNLSRPTPYTVKFDNPLFHPISGYSPILSSEPFGYRDRTSTAVVKPLVECYLDDDGYGNVRIYKMVGTEKTIVQNNIGTIDYETGTVFLRNFYPEYLGAGKVDLGMTITPRNTDIFARRNQIIIIDANSTSVTAVPEKTMIDREASDAPFPS